MARFQKRIFQSQQPRTISKQKTTLYSSVLRIREGKLKYESNRSSLWVRTLFSSKAFEITRLAGLLT